MRQHIVSTAMAMGYLASAVVSADQIVCTADGMGNDMCDVVQPNVLNATTEYNSLVFQPGDTVIISASGCAQTGGSGKTWKRYLNPSPTSDHKYFGTISIAGVTNGVVPISSVANKQLPPASGGTLTLGYKDDHFSDNGYWSHDNGSADQCKDQSGPSRGRAVVHLQIHRSAQPALPAGTVSGQCLRPDAIHESCHIDRPDVTVSKEAYPSVRFCSGDTVKVAARGCVQTGGKGKTWKNYVNPQGPNSNNLYFGQIDIPGVTAGMVRLSSVVNSASLPVSTGGTLTLGYADDHLGDNGYWSHDNGTQNQCPTSQAASVDITITHDRDTRLGCGNVFPVTGNTPDTAAFGQSETAATVVNRGGGRRIVVAFNDQTQTGFPPTISWTPPTTRITSPGASLMGWAFSDDDGVHWTYAGKISPTIAGWPVLWGDPAIATVPDPFTNVVMMSNLSIPTSEIESPEFVSRVGGACIAKSTDGAQTFALIQCVSHSDSLAPAGHFYDGESLAATPSGAIYIAFNDATTDTIVVWGTPNHNIPFTQIADPFPGMTSLTHARLRAASDGSVYAVSSFIGMLPDGSSGPVVYINRYSSGNWGTPQQASEIMVSNLGTTQALTCTRVFREPSSRFALHHSSRSTWAQHPQADKTRCASWSHE